MIKSALFLFLLLFPGEMCGQDEDANSPCGRFERFVEKKALESIYAFSREIDPGFRPPSPIMREPFVASDGVNIVGYKIPCNNSGNGFILVAQGNAMRASDMLWLRWLQGLCGRHAAIYMFDYRGTGLSAGSPTAPLSRFIQDYREIFQTLSARYPRGAERNLYGISGGGVVLVNAVKTGYSRLVLDSTPDILPVRCWHRHFRPSRQIPTNARRIMIMAGKNDRKVALSRVAPLIEVAEARGAHIMKADLPHPDEDSQADTFMRFRYVLDFLNKDGH
jgi:pimeloyl-ACP methyl ester carboxylesterase